MIQNKDLSSKVLVSLLTMSCVYLGGTYALPMAEAADYEVVVHDNMAFEPTQNIIGGDTVLGNWSDFQALKASGAAPAAYNALFHAKNPAVTDDYGAYAWNLTNAIDSFNAADANHCELGLGDNNLTITSTGVPGYSRNGLFLLDQTECDVKLAGTGSLTLVSNENITGAFNRNYSMMYIGGRGNENKVTVDMAEFNIIAKESVGTSGSKLFSGIQINGDTTNGHEKGITVTGDTKIEVENTTKSASGLYLRNISASNNMKTDFQKITVDVKAAEEAYGVYSQANFAARNDLIFNQAASFTVESTDPANSSDAYGLVTISDGYLSDRASHQVEFKDSSQITAQSNAGSVGIYASVTNEGENIYKFQRDAAITANSNTANTAYGLYVTAGAQSTSVNAVNRFDFSGKADIHVGSDGKDAVAVFSEAQGTGSLNKIDFNSELNISSGTDSDRVTGLHGVTKDDAAQSIINVNGETSIITNGNDNDYVAQGFGSGTVVNVNQNGGSKVRGVGHLYAGTGATINWNMDAAGSSLEGWLQSSASGEVNLTGRGSQVIFEGGSQLLDADGIINVDLQDAALWKMADSSELTNLQMASAAALDMRADGNAYSTLTTENLRGTGGVFKMDIDVRTMESDQILVTGDFSGTQALDIYQKDNYIPAAGSTEGIGLVLASVNGDGVFTAKEREGTLFYTHYDLSKKDSANAAYDFDWYLNKIVKTDEPTTSVETVLSANALNYHTWRSENDKLLRRMGELRNNGEAAQGAWFRMQGSKIGRSGSFGFENKYTAYELGYDGVTKNTDNGKRYLGVALSYTDGNSSYSSGSGDNSSKAISFYNTAIGSKGHYLDLVLKISNMDNDFAVYDTSSNKITGDFNNTGVALSAEYGRKNALNNGWYVEPQAQFTLGYLGGDNYTASNGIEVSQSGIRSAVGRIGFNIGKEVGSKGIVYAKANLLHEFGGGYDVTMRDSSGRVAVSDSFNDTWFEYGIGAALQTGKNNHIYFDVERSSGSDFKKDWQWNAGARWTF